MDIDQYHFKMFEDNLNDILKNPWKEPVIVQDSIPTFPVEDNDEDRLLHNIITFLFISNRLVIPFLSTVYYLCLNKVYFLKYILETYSTREDFAAMFMGSSRLTTHEIFEALKSMSPNNISFLLDKIDCNISVYSKIKEALSLGEESRFEEAIDECNLSSIMPSLKYILFVKQQVNQIKNPPIQNEKEPDFDLETEKQRLQTELESKLTEELNFSPNSKLLHDHKLFFNELWDLMKDPDEHLNSCFPSLYNQYYLMREGGGLNESDNKAFEYIFHQPAFKEQYEKCLKSAKTTKWELPTEFFNKTYKMQCNTSEYFPSFLKHELDLDNIPINKQEMVMILLNKAFETLINNLARPDQINGKKEYKRGYIDDDNITKSSFAHALTGRKVDSEIIPVKWKRPNPLSRKKFDYLNDLCYLVKKLYPSPLTDENNKKIQRYQHIAKVFDFSDGPEGPKELSKLKSSYAKNAGEDMKKIVDDFINDVRDINNKVFPLIDQQPATSH